MRVWLDDVREMPERFTHWVKTVDEAIALLATGQVTFISLDNDLGEASATGEEVAKYIEEKAYSGELGKLDWEVHTDNPVAYYRITMALANADKFWG